MKNNFFLLLLFLSIQPLYVICSYPPIKNIELCEELNTLRQSIASNDTKSKTIIKNLKKFIKTYSQEALSFTNTRGNTLLSEAAFRNRCNIVQFLIDNNVDVNSIDKHGNTALHRACRSGINKHKDKSFKIIQILIPLTQNLSLDNIYNETPFTLISNNPIFNKSEKQLLLKKIINYDNKKTEPELLYEHPKNIVENLYLNSEYETTLFCVHTIDESNPLLLLQACEAIPLNNNLTFNQKVDSIKYIFDKLGYDKEQTPFSQPLTKNQINYVNNINLDT